MSTTDETVPVTVVIACHTEDRWDSLRDAIASALEQKPPPEKVVVSVDHNRALYERLVKEIPTVQAVENSFQKGASGTRNSGAAVATTPLLAFLDDDARATPGWLEEILSPFEDPHVVGTGGSVSPAWQVKAPRWFPDEFGWVVGASFRGLPTEKCRIRNVWSESMAVRTDVFREVGGFRTDFGKVGQRSRPEDTELCMRTAKSVPGGYWLYVPDARIEHVVGPERSKIGFFIRRSYAEGRGKVELSRYHKEVGDMNHERNYLTKILPLGVLRNLKEAATGGGIAPLTRAGAILVGVFSAAVGGVVSLLGIKSTAD